MSDVEKHETLPPSEHGPYRSQRLGDVAIPPDRRKLHAALLVVVSMITGAALYRLGEEVLAHPPRAHAQPPALIPRDGVLAKVTLEGPGGPITLPMERGAIVNVWLQGCADCMPAFEAYRQLAENDGLHTQLPVVNVAYGEADLAWARRYGLDQRLVFDRGAAVVQPMGISSFTTLVIDRHGTVVHRDRPDRVGYALRVRSAAAMVAR